MITEVERIQFKVTLPEGFPLEPRQGTIEISAGYGVEVPASDILDANKVVVI
jgi:hypothetical protein